MAINIYDKRFISNSGFNKHMPCHSGESHYGCQCGIRYQVFDRPQSSEGQHGCQCCIRYKVFSPIVPSSRPRSSESQYGCQYCIMYCQRIIRYNIFFHPSCPRPILLRVKQLVNMIVNFGLGIRFFFHPPCPRPHSSESQIVSQYDCQRIIRYQVFFSPIMLSSPFV